MHKETNSKGWIMTTVYNDSTCNTFAKKHLYVKIEAPQIASKDYTLGFTPAADQDGSVDITSICERYAIEKANHTNAKLKVKIYGFDEVQRPCY